MLSLVSETNISCTFLTDIPIRWQTRPISFAKATLAACQVLSTYFTISAVSMAVRIGLASTGRKTRASVLADRSSVAPITVFGGGDATGAYSFVVFDLNPPELFTVGLEEVVADGVVANIHPDLAEAVHHALEAEVRTA